MGGSEPVRAVILLRLSDLRVEAQRGDVHHSLGEREKALRLLAERLGWTVLRVAIENDLSAAKPKGASAFKRRKVKLADGTTALRVHRPVFRNVLADLASGEANGLLAEDLDRVFRDPRDLEDLIDIAQERRINARSLSGSLTFTDGGTDAEITMARLMVTIANKASRDTARRVASARDRLATAGRYGGGPRPYGFEPDGVTVVPGEAEIIAECAERFLQGMSLRSIALTLRNRNVPTATGMAWTSHTVRQTLRRPRNAGLLVHRGDVIGPAPWTPIISPERHEAIARLLRDRRSDGPGPAPRHLGSGLFLCGRCDDGTTVEAASGPTVGGAKRYRCRSRPHLSRDLGRVDDVVRRLVVGRLMSPDAAVLEPLRPATVDLAALRSEAEAVRVNLKGLAEDRALGLLDRAQMLAGTAAAQRRLRELEALMAMAAPVGSPLGELAVSDDVDSAWATLDLAKKRLVIADLLEVTILPAARTGRVFDGLALHVQWRHGATVCPCRRCRTV